MDQESIERLNKEREELENKVKYYLPIVSNDLLEYINDKKNRIYDFKKPFLFLEILLRTYLGKTKKTVLVPSEGRYAQKIIRNYFPDFEIIPAEEYYKYKKNPLDQAIKYYDRTNSPIFCIIPDYDFRKPEIQLRINEIIEQKLDRIFIIKLNIAYPTDNLTKRYVDFYTEYPK